MLTITKSFRLDSALVGKLSKAAKKYGITESQFVTNALAHRIALDPLLPSFEFLSLSSETFQQMLGVMNMDALEMVGWDLGQRHFARAKALFESSGEELRLVQFMREVLANQAHWFRIEGTDSSAKDEITLHHAFSSRWSVFLQSYLSGAYQVVSNERLMVQISDIFIRVKFPREGN